MTIQQLHYAISVANQGSFSAAAEKCFVTQPTLSAQISKLEGELGVLLLDRLKKPVEPTPAGREILAKAHQAMIILQDIPDYILEERRSLSGTLRLGIIPTLSQYLLPMFLKSFLEAHSDLQVEVHEKKSDDILSDVREMRIDGGILALPAATPGLEEKPLFREEFVAYLPPDHADCGDNIDGTVSLEQLGWQNLLILAEGHCFRDQIIDVCGQASAQPGARLQFTTGSLESLRTLVDQQLGYTLLPELAAGNVPPDRRRQIRKIADFNLSRRIGLVYHPAFVRTRLLDQLTEAIRTGLASKINKNPPS